jgi:hypothetical protein
MNTFQECAICGEEFFAKDNAEICELCERERLDQLDIDRMVNEGGPALPHE